MYTTDMTFEKVLNGFFREVDCSQAVFSEFAPQFGIDKVTALKIAAIFGCGMCEGETCGAVVGALMSLGLKYGQGYDADRGKKNLMLEKAGKFKKMFSDKYGSCICREMLGYKLPEEMDQIKAENKFETVCSHAVVDACRICTDILNEE